MDKIGSKYVVGSVRFILFLMLNLIILIGTSLIYLYYYYFGIPEIAKGVNSKVVLKVGGLSPFLLFYGIGLFYFRPCMFRFFGILDRGDFYDDGDLLQE